MRAAALAPLALAALASLAALAPTSPAQAAPTPGPRLTARIVTVIPIGPAKASIVFNKGADHGVTMADWVKHPRGVCKPAEIYPLRTKCVLPIGDRDIGAITALEIWSPEDVTPEQLAAWSEPEPPEPKAPPAPERGVRGRAPQLVVYRRFGDTRMTHACLGFTGDGSAAYVLTGGTRDTNGPEAPLVLSRFGLDGSVQPIPIADPGAPTEASTAALDALRERLALMACHEATQEALPRRVPADDAATSWPARATHGPGRDDVFLWIDRTHLNGATSKPTRNGAKLSPRALLPVLVSPANGGAPEPERLGDVYYLPGADLYVVHLYGDGSERRVAVRFPPP